MQKHELIMKVVAQVSRNLPHFNVEEFSEMQVAKENQALEKMKMGVAMLLAAVSMMGSPEIEMGVEAGSTDCLDVCQTASVQPNNHGLTLRCKHKCTNRCGLD